MAASSRGAVRRPAVAGYYYPSDPAELGALIDALTRPGCPPAQACAVIVPHGSLRHAGAILGSTLAQVRIPRRCLVLGASHTNTWMRWSVMTAGSYLTPFGELPVDEACAEALRRRCAFLEPDAWSQRGEHAIEVIVPFLQRLGPPDLTLVPIMTGSDDPSEFNRLGEALAQVVRLQEEPCLLIASTDLSHYEPAARGASQDRLVLEAIESLDHDRLVRLVREQGIRMCGYGAVACVLQAARALGAHAAHVVAHGTSADAGGDPDSAIGYAGVVVG